MRELNARDKKGNKKDSPPPPAPPCQPLLDHLLSLPEIEDETNLPLSRKRHFIFDIVNDLLLLLVLRQRCDHSLCYIPLVSGC